MACRLCWLVCLVLGSFCVQEAAAVFAPQTDVHVQLFEWSWDDVAAECEQYLGPNKFAAVQVSPPQEHVQGASWWTRYQPVSYLLAGRGGGPDKFAKMITRCNTAGVAVYVDVVLNHMAAAPAQGNATGTGGSSYGNRRFPDYAPEHFHHDKSSLSSNCKQGSDVSDRRVVQTCDSGDLPDLNTADAHVQQTQAAYLTHLTSLGVAGARIDSAKLIDAKELQAVFGQAKKPPPGLWFADAEVYQVVSDVVLPGEYTGLGLVGEFKFPVEVQKHFAADAAVQYLSDLGPKWGLLPSAQAVSFLDNQDLQRYAADTTLTYKDGAVYRIATLFMLAYGYGYPRLMSSYYFAKYDDPPPADPVHGTGDVVRCGADQPWVCEHRTPGVAGMVRWRIAAGNASVSNWQTYQGGNMIAFSRGPAFIAINNAVTAFDGQVQTKLPGGRYCNAAAASRVTLVANKAVCDDSDKLKVNDDGTLQVVISAHDAVAVSVS